jgi:acyl carrier protein
VGESDAASVAECLAALVGGALALEQALAGWQLELAVMHGSLASVQGGVGLLGYSAATSVLDALATARARGGGLGWMSISWESWQAEEQGAGEQELLGGSKELGEWALNVEEAGAVLERLAYWRPAPHVVIASAPLEARREQIEQRRRRAGRRREQLDRADAQHARPELKTQYEIPQSALEETIAAVWQQVLGIATIGRQDNFFELGGDSLIAVQAVEQLKRALGRDLPAVSLYQRPTIQALAELLQEHPDQQAQQRATRLAERIEENKRYRQQQQQRRVSKLSRGDT